MSLNVTTIEAEAKGFFHTAVSRAAAFFSELGASIKHLFLVLKGDVIVHVIIPIEQRLGKSTVTVSVAPVVAPVPAPAPVTPPTAS